ncbi:hypothetical protein ACS0TY_030286 [Phlomoides rotata]
MEFPISASSFRPLLFTFFCALFPSLTVSVPIYNSSIPINFTASYLQYVDNSGAGAFLSSPANNFQARIINSKPESRSFYFVIVHVLSNAIIWSANRNQPISQSSQLRLTADGLTLFNDTRNPIWSTPRNRSAVSSMQLLESGNLILLDGLNNTLWESFEFPTDTLVLGQKLYLGKSLISSNKDDLSEGDYRLVIGDGDALWQWNFMNYWKLSMERNAFTDTNFAVEYMVLNGTGVFLMGGNGGRIVMSVAVNDLNGVPFNSSDFQMVNLDDRGVLTVTSYNRNERAMKEAFKAPSDVCIIPYICRRLGVCGNGGSCTCAPAFHSDPKISNGDCAPTDTSLVLPGPCNGSSSSSTSVKYLSLRNNLDYFSNEFTDPVMRGANLSYCQSLCSLNCSCLGVFYAQSSGSCFMVRNFLGSVSVNSGSTDRSGYVKAIALRSPNGDEDEKDFPILALVLLPISGVLIVAIIAVLILMRRKKRMWRRRTNSKLGHSSSEGEIEFVSIPGLPVRIDYQELADATDGFKNQIGSGGFGTVFKGTLQDGSDVAVKKITCMGAHGNREFLTEIAVIGKIHHVNLVKLKGFCAHRGQRLLVYEFMKRGSLDRTLFGGEPVLGWRERYEIALGTARGLAYLHSGCEHKIIHCDVKPENILLHDTSQVKISDFGLSKLLSPEQSGLFTTMRGTRGYLAPEWLTSSVISDKTDVYSYGMVLLEIIRGKKNSSPQTQRNNNNNNNTSGTDEGEDRMLGNAQSLPSSGEESGHRLIYFPLFALEMHEEGRYTEVVDPRLMGRVRRNEVEKLVRVALCCVHEEPNLRPSISNVVGMLEGAVPLGEPQVESLNFLRFYGRRFTETSTMEENGEAMLYRQPMANATSSSSYDSFSYMSSQQVSGPR